MKKYVKRVLIGIAVLILIVIIFVGYKLTVLHIMKTEITGNSSYTIDIKCRVSDKIMYKLLPVLEMTEVEVDEIHLQGKKDGNIYYGNLFVNDYELPVVEFYECDGKTYINLCTVLRFIVNETRDSIPDTVEEILDTDSDLYITNEAIEELVGKSDRKMSDAIKEMVDYRFNIRFGLGTFNESKRFARGTIKNNLGRIEFDLSYKEDKSVELKKPKAISKLDVIIAKKVTEFLVEKYKESKND